LAGRRPVQHLSQHLMHHLSQHPAQLTKPSAVPRDPPPGARAPLALLHAHTYASRSSGQTHT